LPDKNASALKVLLICGNSIVGERQTAAKVFVKDVFINQDRKLGVQRRSDTVLVLTISVKIIKLNPTSLPYCRRITIN